MASLKKIQKITRAGRIEFEDGAGDLNFRYRPHYYTPRLIREYEASQSEDKATPALVEMFLGLVTTWDLLLDDGLDDQGMQVRPVVPCPLTTEGLDDVPLSIMGDVVKEIGKRQAADPTETPTS